jgi:pimeloyl-ACP methyl ester carboxylesterase
VALAVLGVLAVVLEAWLEKREAARLTAGETFTTVDRASVRYRLRGARGHGPTVVLLPGIAGSIEQMALLQERLAPAVSVLTYDRGGYGFSHGSIAHGATEQAIELRELLDALGLHEPVIILGYSTSALVARAFAGAYSARTAGLYLVEPDHPELQHEEARADPRGEYQRWVARVLVTTTFGFDRLANQMSPNASDRSLGAQRVRELLQSRHHSWALAREWYLLKRSFDEAAAARLGNLPLEVLFTGSTDPWSLRRERAYRAFVAHSRRGIVTKLPYYPHEHLFEPGPVLDAIEHGIVAMAAGAAATPAAQ